MPSDTQLCGRCGVSVPPGASHADQDSCIKALRHELKRALSCRSCKGSIQEPLCSTCAVVAYGKGVLNEGAKKAAPAILGWMMNQGEKPGSGEGKRFE